MESPQQRAEPQTLAGLVLALESGEPCPVCGAELVTSTSEEDAGPETERTRSAESDGLPLECPQCGCQIFESRGSATSKGCWCGGLAA